MLFSTVFAVILFACTPSQLEASCWRFKDPTVQLWQIIDTHTTRPGCDIRTITKQFYRDSKKIYKLLNDGANYWSPDDANRTMLSVAYTKRYAAFFDGFAQFITATINKKDQDLIGELRTELPDIFKCTVLPDSDTEEAVPLRTLIAHLAVPEDSPEHAEKVQAAATQLINIATAAAVLHTAATTIRERECPAPGMRLSRSFTRLIELVAR